MPVFPFPFVKIAQTATYTDFIFSIMQSPFKEKYIFVKNSFIHIK